MPTVKVRIFNKGKIPGLGLGPFRTPVSISLEKYESLKKMGYSISIVNTSSNISLETISSIKVEKKEESVTPTVKVEKTETVKEEETVIPFKEEEDKTIENDKDLSADAVYTESFLTTRNICKKILNARKVSYDSSASLKILVNLVLDSNPTEKVEETETTSEEEITE